MKAAIKILLLFHFSSALGQALPTKKAAIYLTEEEYKNTLWQGARDVALQKDIPLSVLEENYQANFKEVMEASQSLLLKKMKWIEEGTNKQPQKGTKQFAKRKELYKKEIQRAVRDAILNNKLLLKKLTTYDENDRIVSFHSEVIIDTNGLLNVTETIKIYNGNDADNDLIKRGITREFPTHYYNKYGLTTTVPFELISATRNGKSETFKSEKLKNGERYYFGKAEEYLERGYYTYALSYTTARQLIFHDDKDEVYWNVNGTGWKFTIGKVSCRVTFPDSTSIIENNCYTGPYGSTQRDCSFNIERNNIVSFSSTKPLAAQEGMTVSVTIKKGVLNSPSEMDYWLNLLKENAILPALVGIILFLLLINLIAWRRVGRDPQRGVVVPQFEPPSDMSPADCGYIITQKYQPHLFSASIIDYAVNKLVDIDVKREGFIFKNPVYYFKAPATIKNNYKRNDQRYEWYGYDADSLFGEKVEKGSYNTNIANRYNNLSNKLEERWLITNNNSKGIFSLNDNYVGLGYLLMFFVAFAAIIYFVLFSSSWLLIVTCSSLIVLGCVLQALFAKWLKAFTLEGSKKLEKVLGFKRYLEVTEEKQFNTMNPPEKTLQLFEKYLPYAIALECENAWAKKFEQVIADAVQSGYQPSYFNASHHSFSSSSFASDISSGITSTVASASTPPSSSSGGSSSGGGFSGGGGGGGGGGGW